MKIGDGIRTPNELPSYPTIQPYEESDPTVPDWAKAATKPTYTANEVGAVSYAQQTLTKQQQAQARSNIGAASAEQGIPSFSPQDSGKLVIINEAGQLQAMEIAVSGAF